MRVLIRADGGTSIGMGHIMRTSVLAEQLADFSQVVYVCKKGREYEAGKEYISRKGFSIIEIDSSRSIEDIMSIQADCLITDNYDVNANYFSQTKRVFTTGYIDDLNQYSFNVDFLINQNSYAMDMDYKVNPDAQLFLGCQYILLRDEFLNIPTRKINKEVKNVMVTVGGSDFLNITKDVIEQIHKEHPHITIHAVIGYSFPHRWVLEKMAYSNLRLYTNPKMSELMQLCDLGISACGSTLYELAACRIPVIGIVLAHNQERLARKMEALGCILYARNMKDIGSYIEGLTFEKRVEMVTKGQALVDGKGSLRLRDEIKKILYHKHKLMVE